MQAKQFACLVTHEKSPQKRTSFFVGDVVEDVRTVFERKNDATIYIPSFYPTPEYTI